jgi:hypothetical protein
MIKSLLLHNSVWDSPQFQIQVYDKYDCLDWMKVKWLQDIFHLKTQAVEMFSKWNFNSIGRKYPKLGLIHNSSHYLYLSGELEFHISTGKWEDVSLFWQTNSIFYKAYHISLHNKNILTVHLFPMM